MNILNAIKGLFLRCEAGYRVIAGIDSSGNPQLFGVGSPVSATGTLTYDNGGAIATGATVTIGVQTYTFRTALTASTTANEVLVLTGGDDALLNLIRAINRSGTPGTDYGSNTVKNADVTAATSVTAHAFAVTAITAGGVGNNIATTETSTHLSWGATTLTGGANSILQTAVAAGTALIGKVALNPASSAALANVASSATNVTLQAANASRIGLLIQNDSTAILYLKYGATASATSHTVQIPANSYWEMPQPIYTGIVDGIWASSNGNARLTELA